MTNFKTWQVLMVISIALVLLIFGSGVSARPLDSGSGAPALQATATPTPRPTVTPDPNAPKLEGSIRGAVFLDANRNGVMDEGEEGIGGVYFTISQSEYSHTFYSEKRVEDEAGNKYATGYFGPSALPGGLWKITLHVPEGYVATVPVEQVVDVPAIGYVTANLGLYPTSGAAGTGRALLPSTGLMRNGLLLPILVLIGAGLLVVGTLWAVSKVRS